MQRLFHLIEPAAWRAKEKKSEWSPDSLETQGFVHLSFAHQLAGTLAVHYATFSQMLLFELDRTDLDAALRVEAARDAALFPHLYRAVRHSEWLRYWSIRREDARWELPRLGDTDAEDEPRGLAI